MVEEGVDYSFARPGGAALQAAGKRVAGRYLYHGGKGIDRAEFDDLTAHGLDVFFIYEEDGRELLGGFAAGAACALRAESLRAANGLPVRPVYFTADFDASEAQQSAINAALRGAASVIGANRVGFYGGYWPLKRAFDAGVIRYGFQTYAWSGGQWDPRAQVQQYSNGHNINGDVDLLRVVAADYGGTEAAPTTPTIEGEDDMTFHIERQANATTFVLQKDLIIFDPAQEDQNIGNYLRNWQKPFPLNETDLLVALYRVCGISQTLAPWPDGQTITSVLDSVLPGPDKQYTRQVFDAAGTPSLIKYN